MIKDLIYNKPKILNFIAKLKFSKNIKNPDL